MIPIQIRTKVQLIATRNPLTPPASSQPNLARTPRGMRTLPMSCTSKSFLLLRCGLPIPLHALLVLLLPLPPIPLLLRMHHRLRDQITVIIIIAIKITTTITPPSPSSNIATPNSTNSKTNCSPIEFSFALPSPKSTGRAI